MLTALPDLRTLVLVGVDEGIDSKSGKWMADSEVRFEERAVRNEGDDGDGDGKAGWEALERRGGNAYVGRVPEVVRGRVAKRSVVGR